MPTNRLIVGITGASGTAYGIRVLEAASALVRETPLHTGHLRTMVQASEIGAIPALYARPATIDQIVDHTVGRTMDLLGLDTGNFKRWGKDKRPPGEER